jgi:FO synthase
MLDPAAGPPLDELSAAARSVRDNREGPPATVSYSRKVFVDLTRLCRDRCAYCTFVRTPLGARVYPVDGFPVSTEPQPYLTPEQVLSIAGAGARRGCKEALFTLGDRPEDRYEHVRAWLRRRGLDSTAHYVVEMCQLVLSETGLLPHVNPGVMTADEMRAYRRVSASAGLMMESTSRHLFEDPLGCHHGSPDKDPAVRLACLEEAGRQRVPFTTGMLVGIGETLADRVETLVEIAAAHRRHGHVQEVIVQNFRAKPTIPMRDHPEPTTNEMLRTLAVARLVLPPEVALQAPPNLTPHEYDLYLGAGIDDWGGISPVTPDHVNPEAPWPTIPELRERTAAHGGVLRERLCVYPRYAKEPRWVSSEMAGYVATLADPDGFAVGSLDPSTSERIQIGERAPSPR